MASTYSPILRIELIGTGDQSGTWGNTTNVNLGTLIEEAIAGTTTINVTSGNVTLTNLNGVSDQARCMALRVTGTPGISRNLVAPAVSKSYIIANGSNAAVVIKTSVSTGVSIPAGEVSLVYYDTTSADFRLVGRSAASTNTANTLVLRDASGNFAAGTITANLIGNVTGNISGNAGTVTNGVYTTGNQTIGGTKTFSSAIIGDISGNAGTVTNGVYTTGNQTIAGTKTFSSTIIGNISGNAGTVTNGVYTSSTYADPAWITSLAGAKILGTVANANTATTATNLAGGNANTIVYQSSTGTTAYLPAPTTPGANIVWNGSSIVWSAPVSGAGQLINTQYFTVPGTFTYTPTAGTAYVIVEVIGAGGSGGNASPGVATGGGAGGYARKKITSGFSGGLAITVGAGGPAASSTGGIGNSGSTSAFSIFVSATGGSGGSINVAGSSTPGFAPGASGGIGINGDINSRGGGSSSAVYATQSNYGGSAGGSSFYGGGGQGNSTGNNPGIYGSGSGGCNSNPAPGGDGLVIVYEYT